MYNSKVINQRIASLIKAKPFSQKQMLEDCSLNVNLLNKMTDNKGIGCFALARIADYLGTTTDYLLGRTDEPEMIVNISDNTQNNVNGVNSIQVSSVEDETQKEISSILSRLTPRDRTELMMMIYRFADEHIKMEKKKYEQ